MKKIIVLMISLILISGCSNDNNEIEKTIDTESTIELNDYDEIEEADTSEYRYILTCINIRTEPSTDGDVLGQVNEGEYYKVLDQKSNENLTWYKIGENQWIADDGTWTTRYYSIKLKSNNGSKKEEILDYGYDYDALYIDYFRLGYNDFDYDNHVLMGWNTKPDGTGEQYYENTIIKDLCKDTTNVCLYAQWAETTKEDSWYEAKANIDVIDRPSANQNIPYGEIREGDKFSIIETAEYGGHTYDRIAQNSWIVDQRDNLTEIEGEHSLNIDATNIQLPKYIRYYEFIFGNKPDVENDSGEILNFIYNQDGSLSHIECENKHEGYMSYFDNMHVYNFEGTNSIYVYGDFVKNEYDDKGNISKQIVYGKYDDASQISYAIEYSYNENNVLIERTFIQNQNDRSIDIYFRYSYDEAGKLTMYESGMGNKENMSSRNIFEYNGNLVFEYDQYNSDNSDWGEQYKHAFYRYNSNGQLVERWYDYGRTAPCEAFLYFYE